MNPPIADSTRRVQSDEIFSRSKLRPELITWVAERVLRNDFKASGFACLVLEGSVDSFQLRQLMVSLKEALSDYFEKRWGQVLGYYSLCRFDQKKTTRLHLDGGPSCSFLMLGYEPSQVISRFQIADFSRLADDEGTTPREFLDLRNPMFNEEARLALQPHTFEIADWDDSKPRIVIINNGSLPPSSPLPALGVLHGAVIDRVPEEASARIINSTMFVPQSVSSAPAESIETFLSTKLISGAILQATD